MNDILFSVIIPAFNAENSIVECINSVCNQSRTDLIKEIIVVDDGSCDNTVNLVLKLKETSLVPIYLTSISNSGPSKARNVGIKKAKGNWVALLDSDDKWVNDKIEIQYNLIIKNKNIKFLGSQYPLKILFKERKGLVKLNPKEVCIRSMPNCSSVVFEKKTALNFGLFKEDMKYNEDANFFQNYFKINSYYILAQNLTILNIDKNFKIKEKGLSDNSKAMYEGKKYNMEELEKDGLISKQFLFLMKMFCDLKFIRSKIIKLLMLR